MIWKFGGSSEANKSSGFLSAKIHNVGQKLLIKLGTLDRLLFSRSRRKHILAMPYSNRTNFCRKIYLNSSQKRLQLCSVSIFAVAFCLRQLAKLTSMYENFAVDQITVHAQIGEAQTPPNRKLFSSTRHFVAKSRNFLADKESFLVPHRAICFR